MLPIIMLPEGDLRIALHLVPINVVLNLSDKQIIEITLGKMLRNRYFLIDIIWVSSNTVLWVAYDKVICI